MNPKYEPQDESEANVSQADDVNHQSSPTAAATPVLFSSRYILILNRNEHVAAVAVAVAAAAAAAAAAASAAAAAAAAALSGI